MLGNSSIRDLDSKRMNISRQAGAARPREGEEECSNKFRRAVTVEITIEDRKRGNKAAEFKRKKIVSERRIDETKRLILHSIQKGVGGSPLYMDINCEGERNCRRRNKMPNFEEADLVREEM